jgi:hypothetical protein
MAAVHKIAHENVARLRYFPPTSKELEQVKKLAVDVPADRDGASHRLHIAFFDEDFFDLYFGWGEQGEERGGRGLEWVCGGSRRGGRGRDGVGWR